MTLAGWEFWLFDTLYLRRWDAQEPGLVGLAANVWTVHTTGRTGHRA